MSFEIQLLRLCREVTKIGEPKTHEDEDRLDQLYIEISKLKEKYFQREIYAVEFEGSHYFFTDIDDRKKFIHGIKENKNEIIISIKLSGIDYDHLLYINSDNGCNCNHGLNEYDDDYGMTIDEYNGHYNGPPDEGSIAILERHMEELRRRMIEEGLV